MSKVNTVNDHGANENPVEKKAAEDAKKLKTAPQKAAVDAEGHPVDVHGDKLPKEKK
jgi:uncharacterized protein YccT (UPF0319 family)